MARGSYPNNYLSIEDIKTGEFNRAPTEQLIITITKKDIVVEFSYPLNKKEKKVNNYNTRTYHIPNDTVNCFLDFYTQHIEKKRQNIPSETLDEITKDQIYNTGEQSERPQNLKDLPNLKNNHKDILSNHIQERIHKALGLGFFFDDEKEKIATTLRNIEKDIPLLGKIIKEIVTDIKNNFEIWYNKPPKNIFRNGKKGNKKKSKELEQFISNWEPFIDAKVCGDGTPDVEEITDQIQYSLEEAFHNLVHSIEKDLYENKRLFPDSIYEIVPKKIKQKKKR